MVRGRNAVFEMIINAMKMQLIKGVGARGF